MQSGENKKPVLPTIVEEEEEMDLISLITLEYLLNKEQYERYKQGILGEKTNVRYKKDKKFYRKRIVEMTRELCLESVPDTDTKMYPSDVLFAFEHFAKMCIHYFKRLDKSDILQEEYNGFVTKSSEMDLNASVGTSLGTSVDTQLWMPAPAKTVTLLDSFVKRKTIKQKTKMIVPQQKHIHLMNPELKNKGVGKKKNIHHNYDAETSEYKKET